MGGQLLLLLLRYDINDLSIIVEVYYHTVEGDLRRLFELTVYLASIIHSSFYYLTIAAWRQGGKVADFKYGIYVALSSFHCNHGYLFGDGRYFKKRSGTLYINMA
jgi:hypothetical protein